MAGFFKFSILIPLLFKYFDLSIGYKCSTPSTWFDFANRSSGVEAVNTNSFLKKWPGAQVTYRLHQSLSRADLQQVMAAISEYHKKTCVRFVPFKDGDKDFVSIEADDGVCGLAHVCKRGNYQYAKFGQDCRNKNTMVHELGHSLCLNHENERSDRDKYVEACGDNINRNVRPDRFYDFASQMHYKCGDSFKPKDKKIRRCGEQITDGLSVLDVDHINMLYDCGGCFRHRWVPIGKLDKLKASSLPDFGKTSVFGFPLYPCRVFLAQEYLTGTYYSTSQKCVVGQYDKEHVFQDDFEVLVIPGGIKNEDSEYKFVDLEPDMTSGDEIDAVPTGFMLNDSWGRSSVGYLATLQLAIRTKYRDSECDHSNHSILHRRVSPEKTEDSIQMADFFGKLWSVNFYHIGVHVSVCGKESRYSGKRLLLVCKSTMPARVKNTPATQKTDIYKKFKLRHMEIFGGALQSGSTIALDGKLHRDASNVFIDLTEQTAAGSIILHLHFRISADETKLSASSLVNDKWQKEVLAPIMMKNALKKDGKLNLQINCRKHEFSILVDDLEKVVYKSPIPIVNAKFLRVHGDLIVTKVIVGQTLERKVSTNCTNNEDYFDRNSTETKFVIHSSKNCSTLWLGKIFGCKYVPDGLETVVWLGEVYAFVIIFLIISVGIFFLCRRKTKPKYQIVPAELYFDLNYRKY